MYFVLCVVLFSPSASFLPGLFFWILFWHLFQIQPKDKTNKNKQKGTKKKGPNHPHSLHPAHNVALLLPVRRHDRHLLVLLLVRPQGVQRLPLNPTPQLTSFLVPFPLPGCKVRHVCAYTQTLLTPIQGLKLPDARWKTGSWQGTHPPTYLPSIGLSDR